MGVLRLRPGMGGDWMGAAPRVQDALLRHGPVALALVVLLMLGHEFSVLTWSFWRPASTEAPPPAPSAAALVSSSPAGASATDRIVAFHLFGEVPVAPPPSIPVAAPVEAPPVTPLNLELRGVVATRRGGAAIIAEIGGLGNYYNAGDTLPNGVKLLEVYSDRVILERNGQKETLALANRDGIDQAGGLAAAPAESSGAALPSAAPVDTATQSRVAGWMLAQYRHALKNDPQSVMGLLRASPVTENGKMIGYRLAPGKDRNFLGKFGLQPGDVVTRVNGTPMDSQAHGLDVMQKLATANQLSLEVSRGGVTRTIVFQVPAQ